MRKLAGFFQTLAIILLTLSAAGAQEPDNLLDRHFEELARAQTEAEGRKAESTIWEYWFDKAPSAELRTLIDLGIARREAYDYEAAEAVFDELVSKAPEYSEGYNQRAFVRFLREKFDLSLADLEKALELEPRHFGALSGMYHILRLKNRNAAALRSLQLAVELHPWIQERHALPESMWPQNYRDIHKPGSTL